MSIRSIIDAIQEFNKKFELRKVNALTRKDKSSKGKIDKKISSLINVINSCDCFYTTSSCSGRVVLIEETGKKHKNAVLWSCHSKITKQQLVSAIKEAMKKCKKSATLVLKFEPCVVALIAKTLDDAARIVKIAKQIGWKRSGIAINKRGKIFVELMSTEILSLPVPDENINDKMIDILVKEINKKFSRTWQKIEKLKIALQGMKNCNISN